MIHIKLCEGKLSQLNMSFYCATSVSSTFSITNTKTLISLSIKVIDAANNSRLRNMNKTEVFNYRIKLNYKTRKLILASFL